MTGADCFLKRLVARCYVRYVIKEAIMYHVKIMSVEGKDVIA